MPALLERDQWCLWASNGQDWHLMDQALERGSLEAKAESLRRLFTNRKFIVIYGCDKPGTRQ